MTIKNFIPTIAILVSLLLSSCKEEKPLFKLISPEESGVTFNNIIQESDSFNILTEEYIFNGGGVAVADFNGDGLPDLFFSGNQVPNKLYLNRGNFKFEDISEIAGIEAPDKWSTGVVVVDINQDGLPDLYVCAAMKKDSADRANMLFVNQGLNEAGIPVFIDEAEKYGISEKGYSMHATFFDYDNDGDLDLYVLNNVQGTSVPGVYRQKIEDGTAVNNDQFYRNNGDGTFTNITKEANVKIEGFGLGLAIADFNCDGWPDIYICNDYLANDVLYINNQDGTFTNQIKDKMRHQSLFSMGVDASDFNNDGLVDLITLDMLAETNYRKKTTISKNQYQIYINNELYGFQFQHVRNMLQVNNGGNVPFSETGFLSGVYQTDWSWAPLFMDVDNDGLRDLLVTNGFPRDITDKDFANYRAHVSHLTTPSILILDIPIVKIPNYGFKNNGDLTFTDKGDQWGLNIPSFSNGAVFVDLDNDGDLDYVVNNINDKAFIFENTINHKNKISNNYLRINLKGTKQNPYGIGAKVKIKYGDDQMQFHEHHTARGYISSVEKTIHFGLGKVNKVDTLEIIWQEGRRQLLTGVNANQVLEIDIQKSEPVQKEKLQFPFAPKTYSPIFTNSSEELKIVFSHKENDKIDFNIQRTLPHKLSQYGPGIAVGDLNGDGKEDFLLSGAANFSSVAYIQHSDGTFNKIENPFNDKDNENEELGILLLDIDNDGDLDIYAVSGSLEYEPGSDQYQDRIYRNDGRGNFVLDKEALPDTRSSGFTVRAADFDGDGFLDLFVGGRADVGKYPYPDRSFLLKNQNGKFVDVTEELAPGLRKIGMVTDALWTDFDNDGAVDLMIVGELMAVTYFKNVGGKFQKLENTGINKLKGWWNSITAGDFDKDGDIDYIVGNLGLNNYYHATQERPVTVIAKDFDNNGSIDPITFAFYKNREGKYQEFPVHFWDDLYGQSILFRRMFNGYKFYAQATRETLLSAELQQDAYVAEGNYMHTSYIENLGNGKFKMHKLPVEAQYAPVNGMITEDVDGDGNLDVMLIGNDYGNEVFAGRYDAFTGLVLKGDGKGNFKSYGSSESGFLVPGDAKALAKVLSNDNREVYLATQNKTDLKVYSKVNQTEADYFLPEPLDCYVIFEYDNGQVEKCELYYGSGFLSQSTRKVKIPDGIRSITVGNYKGEKRKIK